jgi:hypothetical protein
MRAKILVVEARMYPREGDERLSEVSKDGPRGVAGGRDKFPAKRTKGSGKSDRGAKSKAASDLGRALRSVYDNALREEVPRDFLDLLGRLD